MSLWPILLALIALGGLIAYAGDVVGRRVGRKHVRLFGLRPRTTGLVVAVVSGMIIAVVVFFAFFFLAKDARETILEAQKVRLERDQLLTERDRLTEQVENLKAQAARAFAEEERLRTRERDLTQRLELAQKRLAEVEATRAALKEKLAKVEAQLADREKALADLESKARATEAELAHLQDEQARLALEVKNLDAARREAERRASEAMKALAALKSEQETLSKEVSSLRRQAQTLQADLTELDALRRQLESRNRELRSENEQLTQLLERSRLEAARLKGQVSELKRRGGELEKGLSQALEGRVLAEAFLNPGEKPQDELSRALTQAAAMAKLMGLPDLAPVKVVTETWRAPGLIMVQVTGVTPDGRLAVDVAFVPTRILFETGAVVARTRLPRDRGQALQALVQLRRAAEARLRALGVPEPHLEEGRIPDRELNAFLATLQGENPEVAVVATATLTTTGRIRLAFRAIGP